MARGNSHRGGGRGGKRKRDGADGGGDGEGSGRGSNFKRAYHRNHLENSIKHTVAGPGIFITTSRGRERKAALQLLDVLEEHAKKLYQGVKLEAHVPLFKEETQQKKSKPLEELDEDALWNQGEDSDEPQSAQAADDEHPGMPSGSGEAPQPSSSDNKDVGDDIQAQLMAELAELGGGGGSGQSGGNGKGKGRANGTGDVPRFGIVSQGLIECVTYMRVAPPQDPHKLVYSMLEEVEQTGAARCRHVQRLTPVADTCLATYDSIGTLADHILPRFFTADKPRTYRIEPRIRAHNGVTRDSLIKLIGDAVPANQGHSVNLTEPELVIVVEILKSVCGIGVGENWNRFRRFNPAMIAEQVAKQREGEGQGGRSGAADAVENGGKTTSANVSKAGGGLGRVATAQLQAVKGGEDSAAPSAGGADPSVAASEVTAAAVPNSTAPPTGSAEK
ncbi:hypothetical protein V8E36_008701 [Tilletia maclaganii]